MRQIVLDTETTGLETDRGHRIIEIGGVELVNRRLTGRHFHEYVNPEREIDPGALEVHGLDAAFLSDKPVFADVAPRLLEFISGAELVIHNAPFDVGFLDYEFALLGGDHRVANLCGVTDTLALARHKHPGQKNGLDALCRRYGVDNSARTLHGALLDAEILADVYLLLTGGQTALFGQDESEQTDTAAVPMAVVRPQGGELIVIAPSDDECTAHDAFLDVIEELSPSGAVWRRRDEAVASATEPRV